MNSLYVLFVLILLVHTNVTLAKGKSGGKSGRTTTSHGYGSSDRGNRNNQRKPNQQPAKPNQGVHSSQPGRPVNQHPAYGSPYGKGHVSHPGGYQINQNPNNKILSPGYGASRGYGGYYPQSGSPFSNYARDMGYSPKENSKGFGRRAAMAATGGAVAGMALGYGIGNFPRPSYQLQSRAEEQYYNNYMYRKHVNQGSHGNQGSHRNQGTQQNQGNQGSDQPTDTNEYSREEDYSSPRQSYDVFLNSCMKREDLLPVVNRKSNNTSATTTKTTSTIPMTVSGVTTTTAERGNNSTKNTAVNNISTSAPKALPDGDGDGDGDEDTVSIVEIGYPALIEQMKARKCLQLYMFSSGVRVQGLGMCSCWLLAVVTSSVLMIMNSNMLTLLI